MSFLKAEWRKLAIANYEVDSSLLRDYLPYGTELDLWNGKCYVSLVGFMFVNTRLLNLKIPLHVNFEEVNLRFYVKRLEDQTWKRGVVFIKEIVPRPALTFVANTIYKEHYETLPMRHSWSENATDRVVEYSWRKNAVWQTFRVRASKQASEIQAGSETEFITEHYWGYAKVSDTRTNEYEVTHPRWEAYEVTGYDIDVDFGKVYGQRFSFLNSVQPVSVMLAEGSEITVENKKTIRNAIPA
jgi:uncharacterized protein